MDKPFEAVLRHKIDQKTKPLGALGRLEDLAFQIGCLQQSLSPRLARPTVLVFAADHGIAQAGVSAYPPEVTHQMVLNFLRGGAAINVFCQQNGLALRVVDAGVRHQFDPHPNLVDAKVGLGTRNFLHEPAMTAAELDQCLAWGARLVDELAQTGCNVVGLGEMGIGNTSSASLLMSTLLGLPLAQCVGRGTGLTPGQLAHKTAVLQQAQAAHPVPDGPLAALATFGGFEIAQMAGAMLAAQRRGMVVMVDGFIASAAFLVAHQLDPQLRQHAVFCHQSAELGHQRLLAHWQAEPLLQLGLRLGEGTGCALAYPILQSAVAFLNDMASFDSAQVSSSTIAA
jgi:nicotinate-nucleotide--dimethylbenzimidazole phosphoribosyltransferase